MSEIKEKIAKQIGLKLQKILGEKNIHLAIEMNQINPLDDDFCFASALLKKKDSNLLMTEIFTEFELDFFDDESAAVYDGAWKLAKKNNFYVPTHGSAPILVPKSAMFPSEISTSKELENIPTEKEVIDKELKKFNIADTEIAKLKELYSLLIIAGVEDQAGYDKVAEAEKLIAKKVTAVEKVRKSIKDFYLKTGKAIDNEAKRITLLLLDVKTPLSEKLKVIDDILLKIKEEEDRKANDTLNYRIIELAKYNYAVDVNALGLMTEEAFDLELTYAKQEFQNEIDKKDKLDKETAQLEADKKALADEKIEFEKQKNSSGFFSGSASSDDAKKFDTPDQINTNATSIDDHIAEIGLNLIKESLFNLKDPFDDMTDSEEYKTLKKPEQSMEFMDFSGTIKLAKQYVDFIDNDETYSHNNDYAEMFLREVILTVFGPEGVEFVNKKRP